MRVMIFDFLWRKMLYSCTRCSGRRLRIAALRMLGFCVGENVYIGPYLTLAVGILDKNMILDIGDRVSLGPNVTLLLASHPNNSRLKGILKSPRKIVIEDDAWLGANCVIMPGITIGKCSIVGAGAVVTKDVPPYTVVAGVPARPIRTIDKDGVE